MFASRSGWMEITWTGMERPVRRRLWAEFRTSSYVFRETGVRVCYSCEASSENLLETRHKTWIFGPLFRKKFWGRLCCLKVLKWSLQSDSLVTVCVVRLYIFFQHITFQPSPLNQLGVYIFTSFSWLLEIWLLFTSHFCFLHRDSAPFTQLLWPHPSRQDEKNL